MPRHFISTWFYEEAPGEGGTYPQVGGNPSSERFLDVYRRCVAVFFASARRVAPEANLTLFMNGPWRGDATRTAQVVDDLLGALEVSRRVVPCEFAPPRTWHANWRNQFYVFDALNALNEQMRRDDLAVLLDSDMVWTRTLRARLLWSDLEEKGQLAYAIDYAPDYPINGLTRAELTRIAGELSGSRPHHPLLYAGGEFIAARADRCEQLVLAAKALWPRVLERHREGLSNFSEEAHMLSYLLWQLGFPVTGGSEHIKRIWTQVWRTQTGHPDDLKLTLWHVPAEKRYGLRRLFSRLSSVGPKSWLSIPDDEWLRLSGKALGVPRNSNTKRVRDVGFAVTTRVLDRRLR